MIISILLSSDKTIISLSYKDQILWPVYITIRNQDVKTWRSQKRPEILLLGSILVIYERAEDVNNKTRI